MYSHLHRSSSYPSKTSDSYFHSISDCHSRSYPERPQNSSPKTSFPPFCSYPKDLKLQCGSMRRSCSDRSWKKLVCMMRRMACRPRYQIDSLDIMHISQASGRYARRRASSSSVNRHVIHSTSRGSSRMSTSDPSVASLEICVVDGRSLLGSSGRGMLCARKRCLCRAASEGCRCGRSKGISSNPDLKGSSAHHPGGK